MSEDDLPTILRQKAKGIRNSCGDEWGDFFCEDAAARIEAQAALIAELTEALQWMVDNDETNQGDTPMSDHGGRSWNEINKYWIDGLDRANAALSRAEEAQK